MLNFWASLHCVYGERNVSTTIMGSGTTHISQHRGISPCELLKIMLWTCRVGETPVARPVILSLIVARDLINWTRFSEIEAATHGL
ncbi:TPA: macro domain-containing protein [Stenotrophomonas maltophilia]